MATKKTKPKGQTLFSTFQKELEDQSKEDSRPSGMPTLALVRVETMRMGLTEQDCQYVYDIWLQNGFRTRNGLKIKDWKAALRVWFSHGYFPSQKTTKRPQNDREMDNVIKRLKKK